MHITFLQSKLESHFIQSQTEIEEAKVKSTDTEKKAKRTQLAGVTVSSVQPGCILIETEDCMYCTEERKLYVMVYKTSPLYIFRDSIRVGCECKTLSYDDIISFFSHVVFLAGVYSSREKPQ